MIDDDTEIINGIDVDHLNERPDELHHVAIEKRPDGELKALPFRNDGGPPGYIEIDVDLMQHDRVCEYIEAVTSYDRRIDFTRAAKWPLDTVTFTRSPGSDTL